jgi:hypothetical protein
MFITREFVLHADRNYARANDALKLKPLPQSAGEWPTSSSCRRRQRRKHYSRKRGVSGDHSSGSSCWAVMGSTCTSLPPCFSCYFSACAASFGCPWGPCLPASCSPSSPSLSEGVPSSCKASPGWCHCVYSPAYAPQPCRLPAGAASRPGSPSRTGSPSPGSRPVRALRRWPAAGRAGWPLARRCGGGGSPWCGGPRAGGGEARRVGHVKSGFIFPILWA